MKLTHNHQNPFGPLFENIIADPTGQHRRRMRHAIWLYLYLVAFANLKSGKITARIEEIASRMGIPDATVRSWLGHLRKWHYVSVVKGSDGYHFKIIRWKELADINDTDDVNIPPKITKGPKRNSKTKESFPGDPRDLAQQISNELQATDSLNYFENLCRSYPREIILQAFREAKALPEGQVKKSRGALFVYLTRKYAKAN